MSELECIHKFPVSRFGTVDNTFEAVVPPFRQVGGSRKSADGGIPLVPSKLVEEGIGMGVEGDVDEDEAVETEAKEEVVVRRRHL